MKNLSEYWKKEFNTIKNGTENDWEISKWSHQGFLARYKAVENYINSIRDKLISPIIVDIGSGPGIYSKIFADIDAKIISLDFSQEVLKDGVNKKYFSMPITADAIQTPLRNSSVDIVVCVGVLQHIEPFENLIIEARRILKNNGKLILISRNALYYKDLYLYQGYIRSFFPFALKDYFSSIGIITKIIEPIFINKSYSFLAGLINALFRIRLFSFIILLFARAFMIIGEKYRE